MSRPRREPHIKRRTPPGAPPGTLVVDPTAHGSSMSVIGYGEEKIIEDRHASIEDIQAIRGTLPVLWINVEGLADIDLIQQLGKLLELHDLALEDVINLHQRAKVEDYEDHAFIVTRMAIPGARIESEQVSIFVGEDYVLTFQERPGDCFDPVRERLRRGSSRIRRMGIDYLVYALIDAVIDAYFPVLEQYGERLEILEDAVVSHPEPELIEQMHILKRDLLNLRRAIWPHREMINALVRGEMAVMSDQTRVYLRDCYDHAVQLMDLVETYREIASGLIDAYLSSMSTRLNDIMKVLTIIATVFIPLSFIASLYGMNFDRAASRWNMPELGWTFGYPLALLLMILVAGALLLYFRRNRWIGTARRSPRRIGEMDE